nr:MAG TPA: hypothetical protein [Caudoviricetes sp.]DAZ71197.1 MAG TPA: hypothetical protein [Caudoviricetes sp.]
MRRFETPTYKSSRVSPSTTGAGRQLCPLGL